MPSTTIATIIKMVESLPESGQKRIEQHLREYIEDMDDENKWDISFKKTKSQLIAAARQAKQEIKQGYAKPLDYEQL